MNNSKLKPYIIGGIVILLALGIALASIDRKKTTYDPITYTKITLTDNTKTSPIPSDKVELTVGRYTAVEVAKHNSTADCWTILNGNVYNVTAWIAQHPGGTGAIKGMCGTDSSVNFNTQHGGQKRPESQLVNFKIGVVIN